MQIYTHTYMHMCAIIVFMHIQITICLSLLPLLPSLHDIQCHCVYYYYFYIFIVLPLLRVCCSFTECLPQTISATATATKTKTLNKLYIRIFACIVATAIYVAISNNHTCIHMPVCVRLENENAANKLYNFTINSRSTYVHE